MFRLHLFAALLLLLLTSPLSSIAQCVSTTVSSPNGENPIRITVSDGIPDLISFNHSDAGESAYAYAITDAAFNILKVLDETENTVNFDGSGPGGCWVWGFSYTGDITAQMGDFVFQTQFSTGCWQISKTALSLIRTENTPEVVGQLFASSNTSGVVGVYSFLADNSTRKRNYPSGGLDADGIYYDSSTDVAYQLNRSDNVVQAHSDVNASGLSPTISATSSSDFLNGREIAVSNGQLVVAQDANDSNGGNQFFIYDYSPTSITLSKTYDADINLWGIHADGSTLYAIEDNSNRLAIYEDFFNQAAGTNSATRSVEIEGIVRTHGITYYAENDMMLLTDVGAASSPTDGAFTVVMNFSAASADGMVSMDEQVRVAGDATFLGNPVDIAYDDVRRMIYVAERANGGGRILGFFIPNTSGNIAPVYNNDFAGASGIYFSGGSAMMEAMLVAQLFASSNTSGTVGVFDVMSDNGISMSSFASAGLDADGIYYDAANDGLLQVNRSDNVVNGYLTVSVSPTPIASSSSDFSNGRELAVSGDKAVVAQDANDSNGGNQFFIYTVTPVGILLDKVYDADINLWGIHAEGSTLYAIEDNTNRLSIYEDFFNQAEGAITATTSIEIEGIVRTHGITYYAAMDLMLLTDVGAASSPTDGAFTVIHNFTAASQDGVVSMSEQVRVAGDASFLGNPVDIAYDPTSEMIFVAERANGGGRILGFAMPTSSSDAAPAYNMEFAGASAVYLASVTSNTIVTPDPVERNITIETKQLELFPNPTSNELNIAWERDETATTAIIRVFNLQGQEVLNRVVNMQDNTRSNIDVSNLVDGFYQLIVEYNNTVQQQRFVKQ